MSTVRGKTARDARLLGYAGVIPFALGALSAWLGPSVLPPALAAGVLEWMLLYGAIILSFMGGARWALAMLSDGRTGTPMSGLLTAVTPALIGWLAVVPAALLPLPGWLRLALLAGGFVALLAEDRLGVRRGEAPGWYGALRTRLTICVLISLAVVLGRVATA